MRIRCLAAVLFVSSACSHELPLAQHTGWTLRYVHHTGEGGSGMLRGTHPDVFMALLDGRVRVITSGGLSARLDHRAGTAELCHGDQCALSTTADALAAVADTSSLQHPSGAVETDIAVEALNDRLEVAGLHTDGARYSGAVRHAGGHYVFTVEVRWIVQPGDPTVEASKDYFLAPLVRLGADRLAAAIRRTAGLPLLFDVHIANTPQEGTQDAGGEGSDVYRAAEIGNAPPGL